MAAEQDAGDAMLSDVDEEDDHVPIAVLSAAAADHPSSSSSSSAAAADSSIHGLLAELDEERRARKAAEDSKAEIQVSFNRLKALAHDVIKKRDEAIKEKDEASKAADRSAADLSDAIRQRDSFRAEMDSAAQMLASGIEKISGKVGGGSGPKGSLSGGLPRSQKYTGLPAVAYGVIKRTNEIVEELTRQVEASNKGRDRATEQMEQRSYEIAIEVSQLEATIGGLREDASRRAKEVEDLERLVAERDTKLAELEKEISEARSSGEDFRGKLRSLEAKLETQRPLLLDQLNHISKVYEQVHSIVAAADADSPNPCDSSDSSFVWREVDMDENLRTAVEVMISIYELTKVAAEKVREGAERRNEEVQALNEKVSMLVAEKQHIGTLLRSALTSKTSEVLQVAEDGLREAGIDVKLDSRHGYELHTAAGEEEDEVYTLAGALENTIKASQMKIIELQNLVKALRAESSLLKAHLEAQAKDISQQKLHMKDLEEKERIANESVEGLMMDIASAEEEIARWKAAAEQEAAAGRSVEQEYLSQLSALRQEAEDAKQRMVESDGKLKFKEETASAAMAARDAAEKSLTLVDTRAARLRERVEELSRRLEESGSRNDPRSHQSSSSHRYMCWPWNWLGLDPVIRYQAQAPQQQQQSSNEMELSEPLL